MKIDWDIIWFWLSIFAKIWALAAVSTFLASMILMSVKSYISLAAFSLVVGAHLCFALGSLFMMIFPKEE